MELDSTPIILWMWQYILNADTVDGQGHVIISYCSGYQNPPRDKYSNLIGINPSCCCLNHHVCEFKPPCTKNWLKGSFLG